MMLPMADIYPKQAAMRAVGKASVNALAASMQRIGLRAPITVRPIQKPVNGAMKSVYEIVAGRHRYEAARKLDWTEIAAAVIEEDDPARLWEISENLHRADLTAAERSDHADEWRRR